MDKLLRAQVVNEVKTTMAQAMETYMEQYLSAKELTNQFQMFTSEWLRRYGYLLPRAQAVVTDANGQEHKTGWAYPKNKIARMIADGSIERLQSRQQ